MDMFLITDVARPRIDIGHFDSVATAFDTLASTCASTHTDAAAVVSAVMTDNDGLAARAFRERMLSGGDALVNHLRELAPASTDTTEAYRSVVRTVGPKVESMRTIAQDRGRELALLIQGQADPARITPLIEQTRTDLSQLEQSAVAAITAAFDAVTLPHPLEVDHAVENGVLDAGIASYWESDELTNDQREKILQEIADEYAREHGFPPIKIDFEPIKSDREGWVTYGSYHHGIGGGLGANLTINSDELDKPDIINTVVHEMQHRAQYEGMERRWPWQDERNGMTREEARRWRELNSGHVRGKGEYDGGDPYPPRPIEVDARRAGRDFVNDLTEEEFHDRYVDGVI